jgi:hypothetical protein
MKKPWESLMKKLYRVEAQPRYQMGRKEMSLVVVVSRNVARHNKSSRQLTWLITV